MDITKLQAGDCHLVTIANESRLWASCWRIQVVREFDKHKIKECAAGPTAEDKREPMLLALGGKSLKTCDCARQGRERSLFISGRGKESCVQNLQRANAATEGAKVLLNVLKPQSATKTLGNYATMTTTCITGGVAPKVWTTLMSQ